MRPSEGLAFVVVENRISVLQFLHNLGKKNTKDVLCPLIYTNVFTQPTLLKFAFEVLLQGTRPTQNDMNNTFEWIASSGCVGALHYLWYHVGRPTNLQFFGDRCPVVSMVFFLNRDSEGLIRKSVHKTLESWWGREEDTPHTSFDDFRDTRYMAETFMYLWCKRKPSRLGRLIATKNRRILWSLAKFRVLDQERHDTTCRKIVRMRNTFHRIRDRKRLRF